jgi:hypothetical protein
VAEGASFTTRSTGTTYSGADQIRSFWVGSGSFTNHRFSLVPSYKTQINVGHNGDHAWSTSNATASAISPQVDFGDPAVKTIVNDTFLAGMLHKVRGTWLFWDMTAGPSSPLSYDDYYYYYYYP